MTTKTIHVHCQVEGRFPGEQWVTSPGLLYITIYVLINECIEFELQIPFSFSCGNRTVDIPLSSGFYYTVWVQVKGTPCGYKTTCHVTVM